jgi:putative transposase
MLKACRYKLEPNQCQRHVLACTLDVCRELYNDGLKQRKLHPSSGYEQSEQLTRLKALFPVCKNVYSQVLQRERISNRGSDLLRQHSAAVIRKYRTVRLEVLHVSATSRGNLAKQIPDCSWSAWFRQLPNKAEEARRRFVAADPEYPSQTRLECGFKHPDHRQTQADFACLSSGHQDHADRIAAINMLARNEPPDANVSGVTLCVV